MSNISQLRKDHLNRWFDDFAANIRYDQTDIEQAKFLASEILYAEELRGPLPVVESDLDPLEENLVLLALKRCQLLELPVTAAGLAMMCLGCNMPADVVMNVVFAKKQFELVKNEKLTQADAGFMMMFFGQGTVTEDFYKEMWDKQKVSSESGTQNLFDYLSIEDFKETETLLV